MQKENSDTVNSPFFMALTKEEIVDAKKQQLKEMKEEEETPLVQENVDEGTVDTTVNFLQTGADIEMNINFNTDNNQKQKASSKKDEGTGAWDNVISI